MKNHDRQHPGSTGHLEEEEGTLNRKMIHLRAILGDTFIRTSKSMFRLAVLEFFENLRLVCFLFVHNHLGVILAVQLLYSVFKLY